MTIVKISFIGRISGYTYPGDALHWGGWWMNWSDAAKGLRKITGKR
jgi:hypothetical protein